MSQFWYDTKTSETLAKEVFANAVNQLKYEIIRMKIYSFVNCL